MNLPIGRIGRIVAGRDAGFYVKIVDDKDSTGGFLIWTGGDPQFSQGHDNWVENLSQLQEFFQEAGWQIEWGPSQARD